jgi:hypothetical protein
MINDILSKLITGLDENIDEGNIGEPHLDDTAYEIFPLELERFQKIEHRKIPRRVVFVDGGNQELLGAPNFSVHLNRVYFNIFDGTKRLAQTGLPNRIEFLSTTFSKSREGEIHYDTQVFPARDEWKRYLPLPSHLSISSTDRSIMVGNMRPDIKLVAPIARRFAEWSYSRFIIEEVMQEGDILVVDGSLQTSFRGERKNYLDRLHQLAMKKGVVFTGLSKTSTLFTTTGLSLLGSLSKLAEHNKVDFKWYYNVARGIGPDHAAWIYVTNLHERANHLFRYEISREWVEQMSMQEASDIMSNLAANANDISFPGYPYGLIDADDNARVRGDEIETYRIMLLSEISKRQLWDKFARHMSSSDAHDILNYLKGGITVK